MNKSAVNFNFTENNSALRQQEGPTFYPRPPGTADGGSRNRLLAPNRSLNNLI